jgi:hypothetical protein
MIPLARACNHYAAIEHGLRTVERRLIDGAAASRGDVFVTNG